MGEGFPVIRLEYTCYFQDLKCNSNFNKYRVTERSLYNNYLAAFKVTFKNICHAYLFLVKKNADKIVKNFAKLQNLMDKFLFITALFVEFSFVN